MSSKNHIVKCTYFVCLFYIVAGEKLRESNAKIFKILDSNDDVYLKRDGNIIHDTDGLVKFLHDNADAEYRNFDKKKERIGINLKPNKLIVKRKIPHELETPSLEYDPKFDTVFKPLVRFHKTKKIDNVPNDLYADDYGTKEKSNEKNVLFVNNEKQMNLQKLLKPYKYDLNDKGNNVFFDDKDLMEPFYMDLEQEDSKIYRVNEINQQDSTDITYTERYTKIMHDLDDLREYVFLILMEIDKETSIKEENYKKLKNQKQTNLKGLLNYVTKESKLRSELKSNMKVHKRELLNRLNDIHKQVLQIEDGENSLRDRDSKTNHPSENMPHGSNEQNFETDVTSLIKPFDPWNYWTYQKTINPDVCPGDTVKAGPLCIWTPPH